MTQLDLTKSKIPKYVSTQGQFLNEVLNTGMYDKDWPEDSYDPEYKAAYKKLIEMIGGDPRVGDIDGSYISSQSYPPGATFSKNAFKDVRKYLTDLADDMSHARPAVNSRSGDRRTVIPQLAAVAGLIPY